MNFEAHTIFKKNVKQTTRRKSALPYYYHVHMANYGLWYDQGRTLAHFGEHLKPKIIRKWKNELLTLTLPNNICDWFRLPTKF